MAANSLTECLVAFGSNQGDGPALFQQLVSQVATIAVSQIITSSLFRTPAIGGPRGQPDYTNAVIRFATRASVNQLMEFLQNLERSMGRVRRERWEQRTVDFDLLCFGDLIWNSSAWHIPHPRMSHRRFVLLPAAEIAGEWVHPLIGRSLSELLHALDSREPIVAILTRRPPRDAIHRFGLPAASVEQIDHWPGTASNDWKHLLADRVESMLAIRDRCRLVCFDGHWTDWARNVEALRRVCGGPMVEINAELDDRMAAAELAAAIDAMR